MNVRLFEYQWDTADPVYFSRFYLKSLSREYGWIAGYVADELRIVVPYTIKSRLIFKIATFQSVPMVMASQVTEAEEKTFLNGCVRLLAKMGVDFCSQPPAHAVFRVFPDNAVVTPFGSYIVNLDHPEEELWAGVHAKHRNVILNARKSGVRISFGPSHDIVKLHDILVQTMNRSSMKFVSRIAFVDMVRALGDNVEVAVAYYGDNPIGCGIFPFSKHCAYYQFGGSVDKTPLGSMNLLHWEAMRHFKSQNVHLYDFVGARIQPMPGSKLEGIQRFKRRFGATMKIGYLWKMPLSYRFYIYEFLRKIRARESKDLIDQELEARNCREGKT